MLEISPTATDDEVKSAYRRMAMKHHPDKVASRIASRTASSASNVERLPLKESMATNAFIGANLRINLDS